ncbi:aminoacyltransferase [Macrococcus psychrotolerans]|uniref:Aminoacyltransferase n=1 Tax=Macrococcus psychrotolerans TaxID=3039389 RepID=A0AAU6RHM2_9STAP|nr:MULTISPECIES: aminoacyltransferase [Macrococcus]QYA33845.1 aminoacyltransferase [Macrococcus sp. 19Msa1099]QYA38665.1 aminoacyltransferase [Macrococcus caseolyticus]QYA77372.1 aminoacyltransferase [Macrococcus caseolyticus]
MKFTELTVEEYDQYMWKTEAMSHYFQMKENIENREQKGYPVVLLGVKEGERVIAASLFSKIPMLGGYQYYSNRGPVMDFHDSKLVDFFFRGLDHYLRRHQAVFVKIDPYWIYKRYDKDVNEKDDAANDEIIHQLKQLGYQHKGFKRGYSPDEQVRWMSVMYLHGETPQSLMKQFDSQRKRNIKKAQKYGVKVRMLHKDELNLFLDLYRETEERTGFISRPDDYMQGFNDTYGENILLPLAYIDLDEYMQQLSEELTQAETSRDQMMANENKSEKQLTKIAQKDRDIDHIKQELLEISELRKTDGQILDLAAGMFFQNHYEVNYYSGGSSTKYNKFMGPYAMHWYMINYCLDHGYDRYNFYGVSGDFTEDSEDYGVYRFKRGFNAQIEELVGDFIKPINKTRYNAYQLLTNARTKAAQIKQRIKK